MKTLDLIRYITQHPEYRYITFPDENQCYLPMEAISYLANRDTFNYNASWRLNGSLEEDTLIVYKN